MHVLAELQTSRMGPAPRMEMKVASPPTPASSLVQPWAQADKPEPGYHDHGKLLDAARMEKHRKEMDAHVEEHLEKSYLHRKSIRHSLSMKIGYHNSWQGRFEEAFREAGWAISQVVGCCSQSHAVPAGDAPMRACCGKSFDEEDFMHHGSMPGIDHEF